VVGHLPGIVGDRLFAHLDVHGHLYLWGDRRPDATISLVYPSVQNRTRYPVGGDDFRIRLFHLYGSAHAVPKFEGIQLVHPIQSDDADKQPTRGYRYRYR